ncbi:Glutaredoxin family isoform 1 [Chlorella sorokiniana]|uniref:Glutaredoxin family isoform 1 n=1 Tax=Chlorella sorokiniana TaxID=3076 RepID=A0A2P6U4E8_CHLSO|nr:Glutaredoxin family isoform 1 [Chlorella sorokiniana]|eukprot:PRW61185.1 Glutaredoxin family isoform 1 [Chlorella sorokiniana]
MLCALSLSRSALPGRSQLLNARLRHTAAVGPAPRRPAPIRPSRPGARAMGAAASSEADFTAMVQQKNADNPVMVYSKTYCPYCSEVKSLFERLGVNAKVVELDELADGSKVQEALATVTGRRTVPQVFVGGNHVGGCDDTVAAYNSGKLKTLLEAAGVQAKL